MMLKTVAVEIRRGVAMPGKRSHKYPWDRLKVGDSFLVEANSSGTTLCRCANRKYAPKTFETRMIEGQVWVWRTK
jgi:hypothetical protein